jgi:prephenate dehydrogenase
MKIAIIGGSGKMGKWSAGFLREDGSDVVIAGRNRDKLSEASQRLSVGVATTIEAVRSTDAVVLSVTIDSFAEVVEKIAPHVKTGQPVIDITSVKVLPTEVMHKYIKNGVVLGVHPMFGPGVSNIVNRNFILTPTNDVESDLAMKVEEYLKARGARTITMSPQEHDEMMSIVLGLGHFIALASADTLIELEKLKQSENVAGTTYSVLMTLIGSVASEDPEFYSSLQMYLPSMAQVEELFAGKVEQWARMVQDGNRQKFIDRMGYLRTRLEEQGVDLTGARENARKLLEGN